MIAALKGATDMIATVGHVATAHFAATASMHPEGSAFRTMADSYGREIETDALTDDERATSEAVRKTTADMLGERSAALLADPGLTRKMRENGDLAYPVKRRNHNESTIESLTTQVRVRIRPHVITRVTRQSNSERTHFPERRHFMRRLPGSTVRGLRINYVWTPTRRN